ncbi:hypothetical protein QE152_g36061 [Popillia japonica]|uniref:Gustatory receptor n=1 Tax=Popillia japonica TaxID=7064 RepID=A0AAW1IEC3_POPJA
MIRNTTFLEYIQPLLFLSKIFGMVFFTITKTGNLFLTILDRLPYVTTILAYLRWTYLTYANLPHITYLNQLQANTVLNLLYMFCGSYEIILRYIIYLVYRKRHIIFLLEVDKLDRILQIIRSSPYNLLKQILLFTTYASVRVIIMMLLFLNSTLQIPSLEPILFYNFLGISQNAEMFMVRIYFNELRALYSNINNKLIEFDGVENWNSLTRVCYSHFRLSQLILDCNELFNTSILGSVLTAVVNLANAYALVMLGVWSILDNQPIDSVFFGLATFSCFERLLVIWFLLKIRLDVVKEVSLN